MRKNLICLYCHKNPADRLRPQICHSCKPEYNRQVKLNRVVREQNRAQLKEKIDAYAKQNNITQPKCISDEIKLYYRYLISALGMTEEDQINVLEETERIYQRIRGEPKYTNKNPRSIAAALVYIACVMSGAGLSQREVGEPINVLDTTIRNSYRLLKNDLNL